ncbi:hypothetical protein JYU20_01985 [Bacteroidales bacterium AH-315-I05]|nr:hypothetical protein [Bacteroidales bacterium AH-315-I05]
MRTFLVISAFFFSQLSFGQATIEALANLFSSAFVYQNEELLDVLMPTKQQVIKKYKEVRPNISKEQLDRKIKKVNELHLVKKKKIKEQINQFYNDGKNAGIAWKKTKPETQSSVIEFPLFDTEGTDEFGEFHVNVLHNNINYTIAVYKCFHINGVWKMGDMIRFKKSEMD